MACTKIWKEFIADSTHKVYGVPYGKGKHSLISHVGCAETGLLINFLLPFRVSKSNKDADYHPMMY